MNVSGRMRSCGGIDLKDGLLYDKSMSVFDGEMRIEVAAASGIEAVTKRELAALGYQPGGAARGRIPFVGKFVDVLRANMFLRTAGRVRIVLTSFKACTFDELFDGIYAYDWQEVAPKTGRITVNAKSHGSKLFALSAVQSVAKKAIVKRLTDAYNLTLLEESGENYDIEVAIEDDVVTVALDTSGEGLHKRGWRTFLGEAPIRETLASAMLQLSVWRPDRPFIDPFCGSGTIAIEAAMLGKNIASGMMRRFACENFQFAPKLRPVVQQEAEQLVRRDAKLRISGFDIDPEAIKLAMRHAKAAGVDKDIHLQTMDMRETSSRFKYGVIVTNPPYGERLMSEAELKELYRDFGQMTRRLDEWSVYAITSYRAFEKYFGRPADKVRKLYNSELECNFYAFLGAPPPRNDVKNEK